MKAIIIEDELGSQNVLKKLIKEFTPNIEVVACVGTVLDGVKSIQKYDPDVIFLDIELPRENGFALFNYFDHCNFEVIFTTAYDQYAIKAFEFAAIDYLLKPIDVNRLITAVERLSISKDKISWQMHISSFNDYLEKRSTKIPIPTVEGYLFIEVGDIIYLEAQNNYTIIHKLEAKIVATKNIGHWENILSPQTFLRIHRSYIINLSKINRYIRAKSPSVVMSGEIHLSVSPSMKNKLLDRLGLK